MRVSADGRGRKAGLWGERGLGAARSGDREGGLSGANPGGAFLAGAGPRGTHGRLAWVQQAHRESPSIMRGLHRRGVGEQLQGEKEVAHLDDGCDALPFLISD